MSLTPLDDLIAASAPREVPSLVESRPLSPAGTGASFYDGESISLPVTGGDRCSVVYSITVLERPEEICGGLLKHNETACAKSKRICHANHRGDGRLGLNTEPTIAVIARNKETVFSAPLLNASIIHESLLNHWLEEKKPILEWNKCFDTARYLYQDKPVLLRKFDQQVDKQFMAKQALKTPGKTRGQLFPILDEPDEEEILFAPHVKLEKSDETDQSDHDRISRIEAYLMEEAAANEDRWSSLKTVLQDAAATSKFHTTQINTIDTVVGVKNSRSFPVEFDGTDLWSTLGAIGRAALEGSKINTEALSTKIQEQVWSEADKKFTATQQFNKFISHMTNWFSSYHDDKAALWAKIHSLDIRGNTSNHGQFFNQFQGVHSSFMNQPTHLEENKLPAPTLKEHRDLKDEIEQLKTLVLKLSLDKDQVSIRFASLGFRSVKDARSFVSQHPEARNFGLMINPYSVCYHIMKDTRGHSMFFDRLHHIKKLGIGTNREAIVMHGFNRPIPELFDTSGDQQSSPYTSAFSKFPTYKDWVEKGKDQIPRGITQVRTQLNIHADNFLRPGSKVHTTCKLSISESCAAMEQFCTWLNKSHDNLVTYGMSQDKAWILTTKLGERVFRELFIARSGVADGFNVCGEETSKIDIAANVWFYVPKTLDILKSFVDADFGNHESIASEYIRFLVHNTNSTEVSTFQSDISNLKEQIEKSKQQWDKDFKSVKLSADSANKAVTTMGNKLTDSTKKIKEWASGQFAKK